MFSPILEQHRALDHQGQLKADLRSYHYQDKKELNINSSSHRRTSSRRCLHEVT